ncbi:MAG: PspC domain-containing protein, partial [Chloroflexota bacterium]|nr:PspC domain-containing protein [Chloroflexota bacterium]
MNTDKRLYRSRDDRMIAGVCGGIAEYLNIDPTIVRVAFVLLGLGPMPGILVYLLLAIIIPEEPLLTDRPR